MRNSFLQLKVDTEKIILSSNSLLYKTESFIGQTRYITNIDFLLSKLGETILFNLDNIIQDEKLKISSSDCFLIQTSDKRYTFLFRFGCQIEEKLNKFDVVFFEYIDNQLSKDITYRVDEYVKLHAILNVLVKKDKRNYKVEDYNKLYLISNVSNVNLPRLNDLQKDIVETIDKNVLVQGVAGSGKTNICIDKIIFTACKNYTGKVLYTTFSRGLLVETKLKVDMFVRDLELLLESYKNNNVIFLDYNHKKALENKLGIYFFSDDDNKIFEKIGKIIDYLNFKVDYLLIEDIYKNKIDGYAKFVGQDYFINVYSKNLSNHQIEKCFNKLSKYSKEIVYKEIFGMILGSYSLDVKKDMMSLSDYIVARQNSFSKVECENIYQIAVDFRKHCEKNNLVDNNSASKQLIDAIDTDFEYSLIILDEVQDYTQSNLCLFKRLGLKLFCVGDALQMINPSFFSFGYVKNLLFEKDVTEVKELKNNYRNSAKIEEIIDSLSEINRKEFGTHSFVLKGQSVDNGIKTTAVFVNDNDFVSQIISSNFDDITFIVAGEQQKKDLQKRIKNQEVLTVSEIKGLERNTIIAYNILSVNHEKWRLLELNKVNHKEADENSVYRYYYNLFYVGLSRAKQNIFVVESNQINQFVDFFKDNFEYQESKKAIQSLGEIVSRVEFTQQEVFNRVREFVKLEQFDNARFAASKIKDESKRIDYYRIIEVYEELIHFGKYREAGIKFWEYGLIDEAKKQFTISKDTILIDLIDKCSQNNNKDLNIDILNYYEDIKGNKVAEQFILDTVKKDLSNLKSSFKNIKENFVKGRK